MRHVTIICLALCLAAPASAQESLAAVQGKALCIEYAPDTVRGCDGITELLEVSPESIRLRETTVTPLADFSPDHAMVALIREQPVFAETEQTWSDVVALNSEGRRYLKFVLNVTVTASGALGYCASPADSVSPDTTQLYLSDNTDADTSADIALPPELNRRVFESVRLIAQDRRTQNAFRKDSASDMVDETNALFAGLCGHYRGASFGGEGPDRWEGVARDGARLPGFDIRIRSIADAPSDLSLRP